MLLTSISVRPHLSNLFALLLSNILFPWNRKKANDSMNSPWTQISQLCSESPDCHQACTISQAKLNFLVQVPPASVSAIHTCIWYFSMNCLYWFWDWNFHPDHTIPPEYDVLHVRLVCAASQSTCVIKGQPAKDIGVMSLGLKSPFKYASL